MPPSFSVTGGRPLKGTIRPAGNKNAALPILAATLLADGPCRIENVPHIRDVETLLEQLGAAVTVGATYQVEAKRLVGTDIFLDEPSVTATENALMAAVAARGRTTLRNAACEPHVQDLARFLTSLGADVQGVGTNTLTVEGGRPLKGAAFALGPDHIEIGSFIGLAAVTNGAITIEGVRADDLAATLLAVERLGVRPRLDGTTLVVDAGQE